MDFIRRPETFDVVVGSNLFGDILTDIGAIITGSMGLAPSGNIDPERRYPSMFEPVHGSAPDIMGRGIANPLAAILSGAMMLRHLGEDAAAESVENSVTSVVALGEILTPDLGGSSRTEDVGDAVVSRPDLIGKFKRKGAKSQRRQETSPTNNIKIPFASPRLCV